MLSVSNLPTSNQQVEKAFNDKNKDHGVLLKLTEGNEKFPDLFKEPYKDYLLKLKKDQADGFAWRHPGSEAIDDTFKNTTENRDFEGVDFLLYTVEENNQYKVIGEASCEFDFTIEKEETSSDIENENPTARVDSSLDKDFQRKGIFKNLIDTVEKEAKSSGCDSLAKYVSSTNDRMVKILLDQGYKKKIYNQSMLLFYKYI